MNRADQRTSIGGAFSVSAKMEIRQHLKLPTPYFPNLSGEGKMCGEAHLGRGNDGYFTANKSLVPLHCLDHNRVDCYGFSGVHSYSPLMDPSLAFRSFTALQLCSTSTLCVHEICDHSASPAHRERRKGVSTPPQ